jgi:hypothetical protein
VQNGLIYESILIVWPMKYFHFYQEHSKLSKSTVAHTLLTNIMVSDGLKRTAIIFLNQVKTFYNRYIKKWNK